MSLERHPVISPLNATQQPPLIVSAAMLMQNLLDDVSCVFEKCRGLFDWSDKMATTIAVSAIGALAVLVWLFGFPLLVSLGAMYALRPPKFRSVDKGHSLHLREVCLASFSCV